MKKGYYIYVENCGSEGVKRKIDMQIRAFSERFEMKDLMVRTSVRSLARRMANLLFWRSTEREYREALETMADPDFVYVRRAYADRMYLQFLRDIKTKYPQCRIIVEIPVYPYKKEMLSRPYTFLMYVKEMIYRQHFKDVIDRFVTYSPDDVIFGVPTIRTINGVNVRAISPAEPVSEYDPNKIHLIAVARLIKHHGYERIIRGLYEYYHGAGEREIYVHIVGDGPEGGRYRKLVSKYHLEEYVKFYGSRYGEELDALYNIADAGLAAFGVYKEGISNLCTIKAREYLAKGMPVILGAEDNLFLADARYGLTLPNNARPVDIGKIASYLDQLYLDRSKHTVSREIRDYAMQSVDNAVTLRPVMDYIGG